jgi:hypothetical protein
MDFIGANNTYDDFSTHMYNFWSGLGANISLFALSGTIIGVYRHNLKRFDRINPVNIVRKIEEKEKENHGQENN